MDNLDSKLIKLSKQVEALTELLTGEVSKYINTNRHESAETKEINAALAKAQSEFPKITLNRVSKYLSNPYPDLDNIISPLRKALGNNEISITQRTNLTDKGSLLLETRIWHSTGQWIESMENVRPNDNDINSYRSELNELKKSQIMSLLNITICDDVLDDDGFEAIISRDSRGRVSTRRGEPIVRKSNKESFETINESDLLEVNREIASVPKAVEEKLLKDLGIRSFADLPRSKLRSLLGTIRNNREAYSSN